MASVYWNSVTLRTDLSPYDTDGKWSYGINFVSHLYQVGMATNKLYNGAMVLRYYYDQTSKVLTTDFSASSTAYLWFYSGGGAAAYVDIYALDTVYRPSN